MKDFTKREFFWLHASSSIELYDLIKKRRNTKNEVKAENKKKFTRAIAIKKDLQFNSHNVVHILQDKKLSELFEFLLLEIDKFKFDKQSSVNSTTHNFGLNTELDKLSSVNLKFHTFGVFNYAYNLNLPSLNRYKDYLLLACLVHDFGKSLSLCAEYNLDPSLPHHEISAEYLRRITRKFKYNKFQIEAIKTVVSTLNLHHTKLAKAKTPEEVKKSGYEIDTDVTMKMFLKYLKKCDLRQRQYETDNLESIKKYQELYQKE